MPTGVHRRRILALVAIVFIVGLLVGRVLGSAPEAGSPFTTVSELSVLTVTEGAETVTVTTP